MKIKINLLPGYYEEELKNLKIIGSLGKLVIIAIFSMITFLIFMEACMRFIQIQQTVIENETEKFQVSGIYQQVKNTNDKLIDYDKKATAAKKAINGQQKFWRYFEEFNQIIPQGIYLSDLTIDGEKIFLKGIAQKRDALLQLQKKMEESEKFEAIESPISNLVSETNAEFQINAKLK